MLRLLCLVNALFVFVSVPLSAAEAEGKTLVRLVVAGNLAQALVVADQLISQSKQTVASNPDPKSSWTAMNIYQVGYYLCAKAQLLALQKHDREAEQVFEQAEQYAAAHPEFKYHLIEPGWQEVINGTRGLLLEKKGDLKAAQAVYESTRSEDAFARLALLALRRGDQDEAGRWARKSDFGPTSLLVLGRLEELRQKRLDKGQRPIKSDAAARRYHQAWLKLQEGATGELHIWLPIFYCEAEAIAEAHNRLPPPR
ncbi:MAG TPA: hypothetical protein VGH73_05060 [Thermoanaerobaculia bacterium]|jgi:hypothetical protein